MITLTERINIIDKIKNIFSFLKEKIKDLLNLSFGQKKFIRIDLSKMQSKILSESTEGDLKSHIGYYAEFVTAYNLSKLLEENGGNLTTSRSQPSFLKNLMVQKKKTILSLELTPKYKKEVPGELERMELSGQVLSKSIFEDIRLNGNDYNALQFDIELTGVSGKGTSKADLILTVGKMSKKEIVDQIFASIKAYKTADINLSNNTLISFFKHLFYDNPNAWGKNTEKFISSFSKDYGSEKEIRSLYELQSVISSKMKRGVSKENARLHAKTTHGEVIEIMVKIFNKYYPNHKEEVNARVLKILGFDGSEDFYAAIGKKKQKPISSRQSEEMKEMLDNLNKEFTIVFERNKQTKNANFVFLNKDNKEITKSTITFSDTGSENPQQKINIFAKLGKMLKK
jgi:hypothetical protein